MLVPKANEFPTIIPACLTSLLLQQEAQLLLWLLLLQAFGC
jgi:hypothetical protein